MSRRRYLIACFLLTNLALWAVMWTSYFSHATRYVYKGEPIEGAYPWQVVLGWAISPNIDPLNYLGYKLVFIVDFPSYLVTLVSFNLLFQGHRSPGQYLGTTVGGYELIAWMLLSFVQWYGIALVCSFVSMRLRSAVPPRPIRHNSR
jgi:hypothetical protein